MKKLLSSILLVALAASLPFYPAISANIKEPAGRDLAELRHVFKNPVYDKTLHEKVVFPTVRVSATNTPQKSSGVIVRSDKVGNMYHNVVLTCAHCVGDEDAIYQTEVAKYEDGSFTGWEAYPTIIYDADFECDLAVLLFKSKDKVDVATIAFGVRPYIGTEVCHVGCALNDDPRLEKGIVNSLNGKVRPHPQAVYRTTMYSLPGDSGGPVYFQDRMIGLIQAIKVTSFKGLPTMVNGVSLCIPIDSVKTWDARQNQALRFIYTHKVPLPVQPYAELEYLPLDWDKIQHEEEE